MTSGRSGNRRYLALWFPWLGIDRRIHIGTRAGPPDAPLALVERVKGALRLAAVDPAAARAGLRDGTGLADARVLVPELLVFDHDPVADGALLDRLADGCVRYTPHVAQDGADALVLDVTGAVHLFGGEAGMIADVEARMARLGLRVRTAFGYGPDAALALARFQRVPAADEQAAVARLPVAALRLDPECETALKRAGLATIGDVARRPLSAIAARFGAASVAAIRRMTGEADSPLAFRTVDVPIRCDRRFAEPVARTDYMMERLGELVLEAVAMLDQRGRGGRRFIATFFRADGLTQALAVESGVATRDAKAILRLFRDRLETLADPIDPGFGYDMLRLAVPAHEPLAASQLTLEGGADGAVRQLDALVDRLNTRLGRGRVRRFRACDSHIPEQAQLSLPAVEAGPPGPAWIVSAAEDPPMRPLHLFDPPQRIDVLAEVPDGPPHRFRWRKAFHEIGRYEGPERIASEWWRAKDGNPAHGAPTRDYYRVEDLRGRRFWIFRHGTYDAVAHPVWYVHGLFA